MSDLVVMTCTFLISTGLSALTCGNVTVIFLDFAVRYTYYHNANPIG